MRRVLAGSAIVLAFTGTLLVLPVYAAPLPTPHPIATDVAEVALGSVADPAEEAVVTQDGQVVADGDGVAASAEGQASPTEASPTEASPTDPGTADPQPAGDDVATSGDELPGVPALTVSQPDTDEVETVGVTWRDDPAVRDVRVQVRVADEDGTWGGWTDLAADDIEQNASADTDEQPRGGTAPYWVGPSYGVEAVVQAADGTVPQDVRLALLDPGKSTADTLPAAAGPTDQAHGATDMPRIYTRAEWGADESIRTWDPEYVSTIKAATVHHTADTNDYTAADVPAMLRAIYAYHAQTRGWGDIGYNAIVDKFGRIFEGRYGGLTSTVVGAHAGGFNSYTFGVSMLGNYDSVAVPQATIDAVADVIAWKFSLYGVDPNGTVTLTSGGGGTSRYAAGARVTLPAIFGHRDVGNTSCPGQYGYARLGEIRSKVTGRLAEANNPRGSFDSIATDGQWVTVRGWATDPDTTGPVTIHVYADGANVVAVVPADRTADGVSGAHAYSASFPLVYGRHSVCTYAINVGSGTTNPHLGCRTVVIDDSSFNPRGSLDALAASGRDVTVTGWATDPDTPSPALVHVYVDGVPQVALVADQPATGSEGHGYRWALRLADGRHTVCTYAINVGRGSTNTQLGCRSLTVSMAPVGALDPVTATGRQVAVSGWASDPDTAAAIQVHVYVDGVGRAVLVAGGADHGGHGYAATLTLADGTHNVCAYAINVGDGSSNTHLGCSSLAVSMNPVGALTGVSLEGNQVRVVGWATDPDAPSAATTVHVYLDGAPVMAVAAGGTRPDVSGPHAYDALVPLRTPGAHTLCAYAINVGEGSTNPHLGCRTTTVEPEAFDPTGSPNPLQYSGPVITVSGYAVDPDAVSVLQVHVYVDGVGRAVLLANGAPAPDPADGLRYQGDVQLAVGTHSVCAYAINQGHGTTNPQLACQEAVVAVSAYNPVGALTSVTASGGQVTVAGWASDPDTAGPVTVHTYVDGVGAAILTADQTASGVTGAHAYRVQLPLSAGTHQVCTYGINVGVGTTNTHLGCITVTV